MKKIRRVITILILLVFIIQILPLPTVEAAGVYVLPSPETLDVDTTADGAYQISFDMTDYKHKVGLKWTQVEPGAAIDVLDEDDYGDIVEKGYQIYTSTDNKNFNQYETNISWDTVTAEIDRDGSTPLKSGTIYYAYVAAYHRHILEISDTQTQETVHTSLSSNTVTFMTELEVEVNPVSPEAIQIVWDDVKFNGEHLDYDIEISESKDFVNPNTIQVRAQNISENGPVIPTVGSNGGNDKLVFEASGSDYGMKAGTIYYVKIKPKNLWTQIRYLEESDIAVGYTQIIASMSKLSDEWWKIEWNGITDSTLEEGESVLYKIQRGDSTNPNSLLVTISETTDTKYPVNITSGNYYFVVVAEVNDQFGTAIPDGIRSGELFAVDTPVPATPAVPDIKEVFRKYYPDGEPIYEFYDAQGINLNSESATVAWTSPKSDDGTADLEMVYDIWFLTDPEDIDNENAIKIKGNYTIGSDAASGFITDDANNIIAYKYTFSGLSPNTTYYLKIIAKKLYTVNTDGVLSIEYYESDPALKVIVTPTSGPISQPEAPARPPLSIRLNDDLTEDISATSARIEWSNSWYENFNGTDWVEITVDDYTGNEGDVNYRHVLYDSGVTFQVGYVALTDGMDYQTITSLPMQITGIVNNMQSATQVHNLTGLSSNTSYVVWIRAYRGTENLISDPSDPIVVVTKPDIDEPIEKPIVPSFYYSGQGDTYVDMQWTVKEGYTYYIKYSTSDDIDSASGTVTVAPADIIYTSLYRINGLTQETAYFFWIQADSTGTNNPEGLSLWSDSYTVKTLAYIPPEVPKGFGLKNTSDAVGTDYLTFEWIQVEGLEYILEIAEDIDYVDSEEHQVGAVGEYKVENLRSNFRYAVRLYAYDPVKELRSVPTQSNFSVRTLRSTDDYDSDADIENVITGPYVIETIENGVWKLVVTGVNADRLIEKIKTDQVIDYTFNFSTPPTNLTKRVLEISDRVFVALTNMNENVILDSGFSKTTIRPRVFETTQLNKIRKDNPYYTLEIAIYEENKIGSTPTVDLKYKTKTSNMTINAQDTGTSIPVNSLGRPLVVSFAYSNETFLTDANAGGYYYDAESKTWIRKEVASKYDLVMQKGYASFEADVPGKSAVMSRTGDFTDIYDDPANEEIMQIMAKYDMTSLKDESFRPSDKVKRGEMIKIAFDILGYSAEDDYAMMAAKSGFIDITKVYSMEEECSRMEVLGLIDTLSEKITKTKPGKRVYTSSDTNKITRSNMMIELYTMLQNIGQLDN